MQDINIGEKISEFRKSKNLSIRELADIASVTPSLLSQIERGLANPSINTLRLISAALKTPIFQFFLQPISTKNLIVKSDKRKRLNFPESNNISYELLSPDLNGSLEFVLITLPPSSSSSKNNLSHIGEETAVVLEGKIKLYLDTDEYILYNGDSVRIPPFMAHKWDNIFNKPAKIIFATTPPSF